MQLFYCPQILDGEFALQEEEARHCSKVLRKKIGDQIDLTDGQGTFYKAQLTKLSPKECLFAITDTTAHQKPDHNIHIAISPTKNIDRTEWFVEKAIEIGVNEISFLHTKHSERNKLNLERIKKKAISAIKQSVRPFLPEIHEIQKLSQFIEGTSSKQKFVAHLYKSATPYLNDVAQRNNDYLILIGPEGGFSDEEISFVHQNEFQSVKLGDYRLRTETAGIMACSILNSINFK